MNHRLGPPTGLIITPLAVGDLRRLVKPALAQSELAPCLDEERPDLPPLGTGPLTVGRRCASEGVASEAHARVTSYCNTGGIFKSPTPTKSKKYTKL